MYFTSVCFLKKDDLILQIKENEQLNFHYEKRTRRSLLAGIFFGEFLITVLLAIPFAVILGWGLLSILPEQATIELLPFVLVITIGVVLAIFFNRLWKAYTQEPICGYRKSVVLDFSTRELVVTNEQFSDPCHIQIVREPFDFFILVASIESDDTSSAITLEMMDKPYLAYQSIEPKWNFKIYSENLRERYDTVANEEVIAREEHRIKDIIDAFCGRTGIEYQRYDRAPSRKKSAKRMKTRKERKHDKARATNSKVKK